MRVGKLMAAIGAMAMTSTLTPDLPASDVNPRPPRQRGRDPATYRGARRNKQFGRKPVGNTTPAERRRIWGLEP